MERGRKRVKEGIVVSCKMNKTIVVRVETVFSHPEFKKVVKTYKKFLVDDAKGEAKVGDLVEIMGTKPISKTKFYRLSKVLGRVKLRLKDLPKKTLKEMKNLEAKEKEENQK